MVPAIVRHHDWVDENRDLDGDGLIWIVQPDESGLDASPQFDAIWGRRAHGRSAFIQLIRRNRRLGYDARAIAEDGGPVCCEVLTNVIQCLSRLALGRPSLTPAIIERALRRAHRAVPPSRPARAAAADCDHVDDARPARPARSARVDRPAAGRGPSLDPEQFWLPVPPPSVSAGDPSFSLDDTGLLGLKRYWRGPTWVNAAWLVWIGLIRLGYEEHAAQLVERLAATIAAQGLREYYHSYSGRGMGAFDFGWSSLIMEMLAPDPRAALSYLCGRPRRLVLTLAVQPKPVTFLACSSSIDTGGCGTRRCTAG